MLTFDAHAPVPTVAVGGVDLPPPMAEKVHHIEVESQRNLPTTCTVELLDDDGLVVDSPMLVVGQPLEVRASSASEDPTATAIRPLFDGELVAVELALSEAGGARVLLRGYDRGHRLHRTRTTRTFLQQNDATIVQQVASDHGLSARTDPTPGINAYLCQHNQTDGEFLAERARELGFELAVEGRQLVFRKAGPDPLAGPPQPLTNGVDLLRFRARASSAAQPTTTRVRAFNPALKQPIQGLSVPPVPENVPGDPTLLPATIATSFGTTEQVETALTADLQPEAMLHASAARNHHAATAFEADGTCMGNPAVRAGAQVLVKGVGIRFSGTYTVSSARHVFDGEGFRTEFTVSGTHDRSLLGLARPGTGNGAAGDDGRRGRQHSPVLGKVSDTNDPLALGRVRVELPWLGDQVASNWAPVVSVGAGKDRGLQVVPERDDLVLVAFEHGDLRRPYVLGGLWNSMDRPPEPLAVVAGQTEVRSFATRAGHRLRFDDTVGKQQVVLETAAGSTLTMVEGPKPALTLNDAGGNKLHIDGTTNKVTLTSNADLAIEAGANLALTATGNVEVSAGGNLTLSANANADLKAMAALTVDGAAGATLSSSARATVRAPMVQIN